MPKTLFDIQPLLPAIDAKQLIITPNSRLKNKLLQAYNLHRQTAGDKVWLAPRVFSLQQWLDHCYQQLLDQGCLETPRILASSQQRKLLWQQLLDADDQGAELINPARLINDADTALTTLERWQVALNTLELDQSAEERLLKRWLPEFQKALESKQLQTFEQLQNQINLAYKQGQLTPEDSLVLLGFDDIPPLTETSFKLISKNLEHLNPAPTQNTLVCRVECESTDDEFDNVARWAKQVLKSDPEASIGIIAPNLGQCRQPLEQALIRVFEPNYFLPETPRYTLPFNFSTGIPLASTPLIFDALALLKLNLHEWDLEQLFNLLHSPFWGPESNAEYLYQLINLLKKRGRRKLRSARFRSLCHKLSSSEEFQSGTSTEGEIDSDHYPTWLDHTLQQLADKARHRAKMQLPSRWAKDFATQLETLQWPGTRRLDSNEFQQATRWHQLLETFSQLDQLQKPFTCFEAIDQLTQLASNEPFQAQTLDSPIQVLGILEGAGLSFSHCWVLGLTQNDWPPTPQPNPLLPVELQRQLAMPHASAERELAYAQALLEHYKKAAQTVILSHASGDGDSHVQPSPLIKDQPLKPLHELVGVQSKTGHNSAALEWLDVSSAPAISEQEKTHLRGGSGIFKNQASNPFAAFAIHRLGADQIIEPSAGFNPIARGQILHDVLEAIWGVFSKKQDLLNCPDLELQALIAKQVNLQLSRYQQREPEVFGDHYIRLESQRQCRLIHQWLELEKERPDFSVRECEATITKDFNGLPLTLRLDRLDELATGELLVIDYKTGTPKIDHWAGEYLKEPQLPLYALCYSDDIKALVFAQINSKAIEIKGLGQLSEYHPGITDIAKAKKLDLPDEWSEAIKHWQESLSNLATEFLQGQARNNYRVKGVDRHYQGLDALLRSAEQDELQLQRSTFMEQRDKL